MFLLLELVDREYGTPMKKNGVCSTHSVAQSQKILLVMPPTLHSIIVLPPTGERLRLSSIVILPPSHCTPFLFSTASIVVQYYNYVIMTGYSTGVVSVEVLQMMTQ